MSDTNRVSGGSTVRVERPVEGIVLVILDRPESLNALDVTMQNELAVVFGDIAADEAAHVVILTGEGRDFCSGADLAQAASDLQCYTSAEIMERAAGAVVPLLGMPQLTIAAVNGPAVGAGWGLAMACDIRIAGPDAQFIATFIRMGLGPDYGLSQTLPQAVGRQRAVELILTGRAVDADEAVRIGIVTQP